MPHLRSLNAALLLPILALLLGLGMAQTSAAQAATTLYVNAATGDDANDCLSAGTACATIGAAIDKAADGDTIQIGAGIYTESGIIISKDLDLIGAGSANTIVDGARANRLFTLSGRIILQGMTLRNGLTLEDPNVYNSSGGAIRVQTSAIVTLRNLVFEDNESPAFGGAILNLGHLTVEQSRIRNNQAAGAGGGIYHRQISGSPVLTVTQTVITGNVANSGGGISGQAGQIFIEDSYIHENETSGATGQGGGLEMLAFDDPADLVTVERTTIRNNEGNIGGGIYADNTRINLTNVTVSGNVARNNTGGIALRNGETVLNLRNSTVTDNRRISTSGNGRNGLAAVTAATANVYNSIIAGNADSNCGVVTNSVINSLGHNLSSDDSCSFSDSTDLPNTDPLLMPLDDYGAFGPVHALRPGSPAIDAGDNVNCPATDQRGAARPFDGDGDGTATCDIGAVEAAFQLTIVDAVSLAEGTGGSNTAVFTVTLSPAAGEAVSVAYATEDGTGENGATAPEDYTAAGGILTFQPGETLKTIEVPIVTDNVIEPDEIFYANLFDANGAAILIGRSTATILNDDSPPTVNISNAAVQEGNSGTTAMIFHVTLSLAAAEMVTVNWVTQDGAGRNPAAAPDDYVAADGILTFQPGETSKQITVQVVGDVIDEGDDEQFQVVLSNPVNADLGTATGIGTLQDDDNTQLRLSGVAQVLEGNSGLTPAPMTVTLTTPAAFVVTVTYETRPRPVANAATPGVDYEEISGTLTFQPGETVKNFVVNVIGDTLPEADEDLSVFILNGTGNNGTVPIAFSSVFVTILNDDIAPEINIDDVSVNEGDGGTIDAVFTVGLTSAAAQTISVDYATQNLSALANQDYMPISGTLTFQPGETTRTVNVQVMGDEIDEKESEQFRVRLSNPVNAIPGRMTGTATILDEDDATLVLQPGPEVMEGDSGVTPAIFTVRLSNRAAYEITVDYEIRSGEGENGAVAGVDFSGDLSGTITFTPLTNERTFSVDVIGDTESEPNKTFTAHLSNAGVPITVATATATILNDDEQTGVNEEDTQRIYLPTVKK